MFKNKKGVVLKLLHVITALSTGGAERALYNLLEGGLAVNFECHVLSLMGGGAIGEQIKKLGVPVTTLNMRRGIPSIKTINNLRKFVNKEQPNIIQGWMYHGNLAAKLAHSFSRQKTALSWNVRHSLYNLSEEKLLTGQVIRLNKILSGSADIILYNSHLSKKQHENFGFSSKNGLVIPNGINLQQYSNSPLDRKKITEELSIPINSVVVGHVARFHPMKDHPLFLKSAAIIAKQNPDIHFVLCGRGINIENEQLKQHIPPEAQNRFHLLGERSDVPNIMNAMDIYASSSSYGEAFPNVLGEAMACGVPCVATDVGDSHVIVSEYGEIVPSRDIDALTASLNKLIIMSVKERQQLGKKARAHIEKNFALESIVERYCSLYDDLTRHIDG